jgi:hypothetical protein
MRRGAGISGLVRLQGAMNSNGNKNGNGRKRRYSDAEKATFLTALRANNGNMLKTSREMHVPIKTLQHWRDGEGVNADVAEIGKEKERSLADMSEQLARTIWGDMMDAGRREKAGYGHLNAAFGTAIDKMRLLRDQPTSITRTDSLEASIRLWCQETGGSREEAIKYLAPGIPEVAKLASDLVQ